MRFKRGGRTEFAPPPPPPSLGIPARHLPPRHVEKLSASYSTARGARDSSATVCSSVVGLRPRNYHVRKPPYKAATRMPMLNFISIR